MAKVVPFPRPEAALAVFWRTNADWYLTEIDASHIDGLHDDIIRLCITAEHISKPDGTDEDLQVALLRALDMDDPQFTGYELGLMILSTDAVFFK